MEMDDERTICQICMENFDINKKEKYPKILKCCGCKTYCLSCLNDIYKRNNNVIICPICRKETKTPPEKLETNEEVFSLMFKCPTCKNKITKNDLFVPLGGSIKFTCEKCQKGSDMKISDYISLILEELKNYFSIFDIGKFDDIFIIEKKIVEKIETYLDEIKGNLIKKVKENIKQIVKIKFDFDLENNYNEFKELTNKLNESYQSMKQFPDVTGNDIDDYIKRLQKDISFYQISFDKVRMYGYNYNRIIDYMGQDDLINLDEDNIISISNFIYTSMGGILFIKEEEGNKKVNTNFIDINKQDDDLIRMNPPGKENENKDLTYTEEKDTVEPNEIMKKKISKNFFKKNKDCSIF